MAAGASAGAPGSSPPCSSASLPTGASSGGALNGVVVQSAAPSAAGFSAHTPVGLAALSASTAPGAAVARSSPYRRRQGTGEVCQATTVGRLMGGVRARARARRGGGAGGGARARAGGSARDALAGAPAPAIAAASISSSSLRYVVDLGMGPALRKTMLLEVGMEAI